MAHEISIKDLQEWEEKEKVLFASSSKEKKKLYVFLIGDYKYEVAKDNERFALVIDRKEAIKIYNSI